MTTNKFEYIRLKIDVDDLDELNDLGSIGFHVVAMIGDYALLEREIGEGYTDGR